MLRLRVTLLVAIAALLAACGGSVPPGGATPAPATASAPASEAPAPSDGPSAATSQPDPSASVPPDETEPPTATPGATETPAATEDPTGSAEPPAAAECSGNAGNREFFAGFARAVDWSSLCAVLPKGWFVSQGTYRLANGGKLLIGYKGPAGATIALSEGAFCGDASGCVPSGTVIGETAMGPFAGTMSRLDDGGYAIVADRGENPSWLFVTHGVDEATSRALGAALVVVPG